MQANHHDPATQSRDEDCPFLGLKDDPATFSGFSSQMNACHHVNPAGVPSLPHQRSFCLSPAYTQCQIWAGEPGGKMPSEVQLKSRKISKRVRRLLTTGGIAFIFTMVIFSLIIGRQWLSSPLMEYIPTLSQNGQSAFEGLQATPEIEDTTHTPISPTASQAEPTQNEVTSTPTPEPQTLALDTPIGDTVQFIIHRVLEGETLQLFADQYNTSVDAITAVNYDLIIPLWIDWIVIIPVNITNVSELPAFTTIMVEKDGTTLSEIALQLSVSLEDMTRYNNIDPNRIFREGEWLLVPREPNQP